MIRITVELISARDARVEHLGTAVIANDGTGTPTSGNYTVTLSQRGDPTRMWRVARVLGFPRQRLLAWDLLYRGLREALGPERNP